MKVDQNHACIPLNEITLADAGRACRKAAVLGELRKAGFPVPEGWVLGTAAHQLALAAAAASADGGLAVPEEVGRELSAVAGRLGGIPLAVRSSSVEEDLAGRSFAGQYETVLGVEGTDAVLAAVRRCWASAASATVREYQGGASGLPAAMAVLIQPLIDADAAGVAFSANPVTGNSDEAMVSAVRGLGERLVSGGASADEWTVTGHEATCHSSPEGALDAGQARAVADLANRVAGDLDSPHDIEWASRGDQLFLPQARPITTLVQPLAVPVSPPPGYWQRDATHMPRPLSPMYRSFLPGMTESFRQMFAHLGFLVETVACAEIGGWGYVRVVPLGGKDRKAPPPLVFAALCRLVPSLRRRIQRSVAAARRDTASGLVEQWYDQWRPELQERISKLRSADPGSLSDQELAEHFRAAAALHERGNQIHFMLQGALYLILGEFACCCRDLLGWDEEKTLGLLSGLSATSTEPARRLGELARILDQTGDEANQSFVAALRAHQEQFGCRALCLEVAEPTLAEVPSLTMSLIRDQITRGKDGGPAAQDEHRAAAQAQARAAAARHSAADSARFEHLLTRAERAFPVREDNEFYTISAPLALVRYAALETGRRLAARGAITRTDDIFFLEVTEAPRALSDHQTRWADLVARRRAERAWVQAHPGPPSYGRDPGPPPAFDALPAEARLAMEALLWSVDRMLAQDRSQLRQPGLANLAGLAASPGRYTGPACVIRSEKELAKLRPGDVLVCPVTSPVWSMLFPNAGALVTDTGGILSHPAIIAREFGIPAVVATGNATSLIQDGQLVTVDGSTGQILLA